MSNTSEGEQVYVTPQSALLGQVVQGISRIRSSLLNLLANKYIFFGLRTTGICFC